MIVLIETFLTIMNNVKRIKLDNNNECDTTKAKDAIPSTVLRSILSDDLVEDTPLMDIYIASIKNPKDTSNVIVNINSVLPFVSLSHLKRVRGKDLFLCPAEYTTKDNVLPMLEQKQFNIDLIESEIKIVKVAKISPKLRKQYDRVNKLWPCNFHSNKYLEKLSTNTLFNKNELVEHGEYMKVAIDVSIVAKSLELSKKTVGCVIIDPKIKSIVAVGFDRSHEGPCRHACMVGVDNVAKTQNGGVWFDTNEVKNSSTDLNLNGIPLEVLEKLQQKYSHLKFGATWFKTKSEVEEPTDGPYLCTGYYLYITHEPCVMCAMGLVHSRIKRVFYSVGSGKGALGTLCKIHTVKDLNHHYEVFAGLLENQVLQL